MLTGSIPSSAQPAVVSATAASPSSPPSSLLYLRRVALHSIALPRTPDRLPLYSVVWAEGEEGAVSSPSSPPPPLLCRRRWGQLVLVLAVAVLLLGSTALLSFLPLLGVIGSLRWRSGLSAPPLSLPVWTFLPSVPSASVPLPPSSPLNATALALSTSVSSLATLLLARTSPSNHLLVLHSLDRWALTNFLCWAERLHFTAFVVLTRSARTQRTLQQRLVPALALPWEGEEGEEEEWEGEEAVDGFPRAPHSGVKEGSHPEDRGGSRRSIRFHLALTAVLQRLLAANVQSLMVSSGGLIPLSRALFSHHSADVELQVLSTPLASSQPNSSAQLFSSLFVVTPTERVKAHFTALSSCLSSALHRPPPSSPSSPTSEAVDCATAPFPSPHSSSSPTLSLSPLRSVPLSPLYYVHLLDYTQRLPSVQGYRPLLVYTGGEWKEDGEAGKRRAMADWGLTAAEEEVQGRGTTGSCRATGARRTEEASEGERVKRRGEEASTVLEFHLRVLTCCGRVESLQRLLQSLLAVDWTAVPSPSTSSLVASIHLRLSISVDSPASPALIEVGSSFCHRLRSNWTSPHLLLQCEALQADSPLGLVGQWTSIPTSSEGREVLIVLEDDLTVTPPFFTFVLHHTLRYHILPPTDPRLFSLSLQSAHTIVGESAHQRYGDRTPEQTLLNRTQGRPLLHPSSPSQRYLYQLIGTWGSVFFPPHYQQLRQWLASLHFNSSSSSSPLQSPCVPFLLSNQWWRRKRHAVWSVWAIRYAYERGLYSLYTRTSASPASLTAHSNSSLLPVGPSVVINWREAGMNFAQSKGRSNEGLEQWGSEEELSRLYAEEPQQLPLFDFHFRDIARGDEATLDYRAATLPSTLFDQCWTRDDWKRGERDGRPPAEPQSAGSEGRLG